MHRTQKDSAAPIGKVLKKDAKLSQVTSVGAMIEDDAADDQSSSTHRSCSASRVPLLVNRIVSSQRLADITRQ